MEACINEVCSVYGEDKSLQLHHDSVTVTVYTLNGPQPAFKQALKDVLAFITIQSLGTKGKNVLISSST